MPNPNTLDWIHVQDIQIPDVNLQQQYQQYFQNGQYSDALSLLTNNATQLQGKAFIANLINTISAGISELENKYYTGVPLFLSSLSSQYFLLINNFLNKGTWNAATEYQPYNFVVYNNDIYMCIGKPPVGTLPTDIAYWLHLGLQGQQGAPGVDVNMRYQWNSTDTYEVNDLVVYGTNIYVALVQNTNVTPGTDSNTWGIFLVTNPGKINVGITAPTNPVQNTVWFETSVDPLAQTTEVPLIGQFYRYNTDINDWEEMYPNVLFRWLDGYSDYASMALYIDLDIQPNKWSNQTYTYSHPYLTEDSYVYVMPGEGINSSQRALYDSLAMSINETNVVFTTNLTPSVDLPIIIQIQ